MYGNTIYLTKYTWGVQMQRGAKNIMIVVEYYHMYVNSHYVPALGVILF